MKEQLKKLWKETFGDDNTFLDLFFTDIYKEENVLFYEKQGKIISALHMLPYQLSLHGEIIPVSYICGVATIPEERGKGHMSSLMKEAHKAIRKRGDSLAILIPASPGLFNYYRAMGYQDFFYYQEFSYLPTNSLNNTDTYQLLPSVSLSFSTLYEFFDRLQQKREISILHSYTDFITIIKDLINTGGELYSLINNKNEIVAQAFVYLQGDNRIIKDIYYDKQTNKELILNQITKTLNNNKIIVREPVQNGHPVPFGMAYAINKKINLQKKKSSGFISLMLE